MHRLNKQYLINKLKASSWEEQTTPLSFSVPNIVLWMKEQTGQNQGVFTLENSFYKNSNEIKLIKMYGHRFYEKHAEV